MSASDPSSDTTEIIRRKVEERVARERDKITSSAEIKVQQATIDALVQGQNELRGEVRTMIDQHTETLVRLERGEGDFKVQRLENAHTRHMVEGIASRVSSLERHRNRGPSQPAPEDAVVLSGSRRLVKILAGLAALLAAMGSLYAMWKGGQHSAIAPTSISQEAKHD